MHSHFLQHMLIFFKDRAVLFLKFRYTPVSRTLASLRLQPFL